jgi:glycosyltransferase domain-containing protein
MIDCSIIIPTHNRHCNIKKSIEYFSAFDKCHIYICDSSVDKYAEELPLNVSYLHMPRMSFVEKMHNTLNKITTEFVTVCADDDFILEKTMIEILAHIETEDYVMGVGSYVGFDVPFKGFFKLYGNLPEVNSNNALQRVKSYLSCYHMSLWAVYKRCTILKAYTILIESNFTNHNLIELTIAISCAIDGKILFLDKIYGVREVNNENSINWSKSHRALLSEYKNNYKKISKEVNEIAIKSNNKFLFKFGMCMYLYFAIKPLVVNKFFINNNNNNNNNNIDLKDDLLKISKIINEKY